MGYENKKIPVRLPRLLHAYDELWHAHPAVIADEILTQSKSVIEHCYQNFLLENNDADDREYTDATDQIREVLIHQHYLSQKDIEICLSFDLASIADRPEIDSIRTLHKVLKTEYGSEEEHDAT